MLIATHTVQLCRPITTLRKKEELCQSHPFLWELTLQNQLSGHPAFDAWFWWSPNGSTDVMTRDAFLALVEKAVPDQNRHYRWVGLRMLVHFCRARDTIWNRYNFPTFERVVDSCRTGCNCGMFTKKLLKNGIHRFGITRLTTCGFSNIVDCRIIIYNRSIWAIWAIALVTRLFSLFLVPWATCSYGAQLVPPNFLVKFLFHDISFLWHDFFFGMTFFSARLFLGVARLFLRGHDSFLSARLFLFGTTFSFWHDSFFFATTFSFWSTSCFRHDFFYSTLQVTAELSQFHFIRKFNMVATGCLKCRFLLFLLLISFSTCTGVLPTYTPLLNVERGDLIERYFHLGLGYSEILLFLGSLHGCFLSLRQLKRMQ